MEDELIVTALVSSQEHNLDKSSKTFYELYQKSGRKIYLKEAVKSSFGAKNIDGFALLEEAIKAYPDDDFFQQMLIMRYLSKKRYDKAEERLIPLLLNEPDHIDYELAVKAYFALKKYDLALKYLQKLYALTNSENNLEQIFYILFEVLDRKNEAISYLESHIALKQSSKKIYYKLISAYSKVQNIDGIIATYKKLYDVEKSKDVAKKILELYMYKKDIKSAIEFLEKSKHDYKTLMELYAIQKEYSKIVTLSERLYKESGSVEMLGYNTIYYYELNKKNIDKKIMLEVVKRFEKLLKRSDDAMYLNYYGYLLIDHDINYKKGIKLVKKALDVEPESISFLDSLAWGYYKLGECDKAYEILNKLMQKTTENEIYIHYKKAQKCKKGTK